MNWHKRSNPIRKIASITFYVGDGLEVFVMNDDPTSLFLSFGDWAEQPEEKAAKFEDEGYSIVEWDYEVGNPGEGWTRIRGTRIGDNL